MDANSSNLTPDPGSREDPSWNSKGHLEMEKLRLEVEKTRCETHRLKSRIWRCVTICAGLVPMFASVAAVTVASLGLIIPYKLGVFSVAQDRIQNQISRLELTKLSLDGDVKVLREEKRQFEADRGTLTNELGQIRVRLKETQEKLDTENLVVDELQFELEFVAETNKLVFPLMREIELRKSEAETARKVVAALGESGGLLYASLLGVAGTNELVRNYLLTNGFWKPAPPTNLRIVSP